MAEFSAAQDMDAYLINPTVTKGDDFQTTNMSGDLIPIFLSDEIMTVKAGKKAVEPTGMIRTFANQSIYDSIFSYDYASEEEAASPVDDDDFGFQSDIDSSPSIKERASLEEADDHATAVQLCTKAQAVQFVSAGKARVVSVPKAVDLSSPDRSPGPQKQRSSAPRQANADSSITSTPDRSPRSSSDRSEAFVSSDEQPRLRTVRRKPKLPPVHGMPRSTGAQTPLAQQRAEFLNHDPYPSNWPLRSPTSASSSKLRLPKLSTSFSLKSLGRPRRSNSSSTRSSDEYSPLEPPLPFSLPASPAVRTIPRSANTSAPRKIARGADERAPTLVLPPCPSDYSEDWSFDLPSEWQTRKDSALGSPVIDSESGLKHIRRKSISAAYVTTQA